MLESPFSVQFSGQMDCVDMAGGYLDVHEWSIYEDELTS